MATKGCRILVVDDDASSRDSLIELLEMKGYVTSAAQNGAAAVRQLKNGFDPDLILTDLTMPIMNGWQLCALLKSTPGWRAIPVVVLCGMGEEQRGKLQVEDAFEKPTDIPVLVSRIEELCGL